ncbi:DeoR/GlpR family DNA-binding transcription regulator [Xanthomonas sp. AM6]|uniref:DeoR/GlpR family DNA-binding transcription regulator n=1 Tax=Xanthomonas sp. AM6 TaxID=2982531 RepID=UPI0021DA395C|nr:DeoR/GlpR family DNA-binding transcription regulator [Xanthomonas sp. AM6]UYB51333.1 DeoR/GlpR family DNA-binding transcription regulator [Xanthomonas sp. AM6]
MTAAADALPQERQQAILQRLREHGRVVATELAAAFAVSEDSIRRDLRELAAQGLCRRVYGGALPPTPSVAPLPQRREEHAERKRALAQAAVELVRPGQVLLIDAGSTNSAIAAALPPRQGLTVVTNAPDIAQLLMPREGFEILLIGGRVDPRIGAAVGAQALQQLRQLRADLCFPGACAIDPERGLWGVDGEESLFKRAMVEASAETIAVVTSDKLGALAAHQVVGVEAIDRLVVEHDAPAGLLAAFAAQAVQVHRAGPAEAAG